MKRILITGSTGFLGQWITKNLREKGLEVFGTSLENSEDPSVWTVDLMNRSGLDRIVKETEPEIILHLAGLARVGHSWSQPGEYFRVNVLGTENILAASQGFPVILASSAEVYGEVPEEEQPLHEDRLPSPSNPYALTKAAAERMVLATNGRVLRFFNVVGPGQAEHFALPSFAHQLSAMARGVRAPVLQVGNLSVRRDFVPVQDAVEAVALVIEQGIDGEIYNVATGRDHSLEEMVERLMTIIGVQVELQVDPERVRPTDIPLLRGDGAKLWAMGWKFKGSLDEALQDLLAEYGEEN